MRTLALFIICLSASVFTDPLEARVSCGEIYAANTLVMAKKIGFTQLAIGKLWAEYKAGLLESKFGQWKEINPKGSRRQFLLESSAEKPLPAIRDIRGVVRIVDKHHGFYSMTRFYGKELDFTLSVRILMDYSIPALGTQGLKFWTKETMIKDMLQKNFIGKVSGELPTYQWLMQLPKSILDMQDLPLRSLMSFLLNSFPIPLGGSDFSPHIQNHLAGKFLDLGIKPFTKNTFSHENFARLRNKIQSMPELHDFLIARLKEGRPSEEISEISTMLSGKTFTLLQ